jgi:hypothetical protein
MVPNSVEFHNTIDAISEITYKRDAKQVRCLEIGSTAEEHTVTIEPLGPDDYDSLSLEFDSDEGTNEGTDVTNQNKRAYSKSVRIVRDLSQGTQKVIHLGKTIKSQTVPPLFVSMKSTPNGTGYYNFPLDRIALNADEDLQEKIQKYLDSYYSGETED